ncbi:MAG: HlyC/CorC family transporter [Deltaproteobacteria bacterium]|nr:HlyC/CorC family transporter [Deltaproteobacteria bacterium]
MDAEIILRLLLFFVLITLSAFFSGSETALFSMGPVQLMRLREEGHPRAALLAQLLGQPRRLIATIFIGNEFVNIAASALMAAVTDRYLHARGHVVVTVVSTSVAVVLILMLGEITPKNVAARLGQRWAVVAARPIWLLALVMAPLRWIIERIADAVVRLVGEARPPEPRGVGEEEFRTMVDEVVRGGEIRESERKLIHNVFEFGDRRVKDVMTPAARVFMLSYNLPLNRMLEEVRRGRYSRIPIYQGNRDRIVGVLYAKDLVAVAHGIERESHRRLQDLLHPGYFIPKATKCEQLFREFRKRRTHQALVVDEYGRFAGLVTMEDLLEELFGEIKDEKDLPPPTGEVRIVPP